MSYFNLPVDNRLKRAVYFNSLLFFIASFLLTSVISVGWIHMDEHFQILEFANFKRGLLHEKYLAWEFRDQIRPALQPAIAYGLLNLMELFHLRDPFVQTVILRLISALLFLASSLLLYRSFKENFNNRLFKSLFFILTFSLYVFPIQGVRFFSENWSASFFVLAIASLFQYVKSNAGPTLKMRNEFFSGLLLGMAFLFRYQSAIMIGSLFIWLATFHLQNIRQWIWLIAGFLLIFLGGIVVDKWFYGNWVLSSWNYFYANLVENKAASFGVAPWWWYFEQLILGRWLTLLNASLLILIFIFGVRKISNPVFWMFFPFLLAHVLIAHKETRFIYPILVFVPFMVSDSLQYLNQVFKNKYINLALLTGILLINSFAFVASCLRINENASEIFKFIRTLPEKPIVIYANSENFYYTLSDDEKTLSPRFYKDTHKIIGRKKIHHLDSLRTLHQSKDDTLAYVVIYPQEQTEVPLEMVYSPESAWLKKLNHRNWMHAHNTDWKLYKLSK